MPSPQDIDSVLEDWDYIPGEVKARVVSRHDGRELLQMRVDMGLLQMEIELRPDGTRPHGAETYFDYLVGEVVREGEEFELSQEQCTEADREFSTTTDDCAGYHYENMQKRQKMPTTASLLWILSENIHLTKNGFCLTNNIDHLYSFTESGKCTRCP